MAKPMNIISHWSHLIENFQASSQQFYTSFEAAVAIRAVPQMETVRVEHKEGGLASAKREYLRMDRGTYAFDICAAPFGTGFFVSWWFTEPPLKFGFLYTIAFLFVMVIAVNIAFGVGLAIGAALSGAAVGMVFATCAVFLGIPLVLWFLGNALRHGAIDGERTILRIPLVGRIYEWIFAPTTYYSLDTALMFQEAVHNAVLEVLDCMTTNSGVRGPSDNERKPVMKRFAASV